MGTNAHAIAAVRSIAFVINFVRPTILPFSGGRTRERSDRRANVMLGGYGSCRSFRIGMTVFDWPCPNGNSYGSPDAYPRDA